ncbi:MAG: hypothetical protein IJO93_05945 [Clostridia bacterium]|nr:hypothetical protein [Clostridia bacterium]
MLLIAIAAYVMNLYDMFCTLYLAAQYGDDIEGNPVGKILLKNKAITVIVKVFCMAAVFALIYVMSAITIFRVLMFVIFGVYCLLTVYHTVILIYLKVHKL